MPTNKENLASDIAGCRSAALNDYQIARKLFVFDQAFVFKDDKILGFKILNSVAEKFRVPLGCVKIAGSAQTGFSPFKNRDFVSGKSDLDIAIVSPSLFQRYCEIAYNITNGYKNFTAFESSSHAEVFQGNLQIGFFRPDMMPTGKDKTEWFDFFRTVTNRYSTHFSNINAGIYFSELFFEGKQTAVVKSIT